MFDASMRFLQQMENDEQHRQISYLLKLFILSRLVQWLRSGLGFKCSFNLSTVILYYCCNVKLRCRLCCNLGVVSGEVLWLVFAPYILVYLNSLDHSIYPSK